MNLVTTNGYLAIRSPLTLDLVTLQLLCSSGTAMRIRLAAPFIGPFDHLLGRQINVLAQNIASWASCGFSGKHSHFFRSLFCL